MSSPASGSASPTADAECKSNLREHIVQTSPPVRRLSEAFSEVYTASDHKRFLHDALTLPIKALDKDGNGRVLRKDVYQILADDGLIPSDPRLASMFEALANECDAIPPDVLLELAVLGGQTVLSALTGNMVIPDFARFRDECKLIYDDLATMTGGKVASYIPQLAKVPPTKFAVAVTTVDGQQFSFGDASEHYCLQVRGC